MDSSFEELSYDSLTNFLKEQEYILQTDKTNLSKKENIDSNLPVSSHALQTRANGSNMVKGATGGYVLVNSREKEKDKLINLLSVPKSRHACPGVRARGGGGGGVPDAREREKDRLAAIFAASPSHPSPASDHQVSKNLNCGFSFSKSPENNCEASIPKVLVSEHEDGGKIAKETNSGSGRIKENGGRMSAMNAMNASELGIGEYEQRRRSFIEQRHLDYNQYLQQKMQQTRSNASDCTSNRHLKDACTQTVWDQPKGCKEEEDMVDDAPDKHSHCVSQRRLSPGTKCSQESDDRELKEQLYREELCKQIEEKNRLKEEMRKKEEDEEAKLEAKIRRDLEKMRRQYEEERLQRLEHAIRKREHDDLLRQTLATEHRKVQEENRTNRKSILKTKPKVSGKAPSVEITVRPHPDRVKSVDVVVREDSGPLLTDSYRVLPPVSPPLLHATLPPFRHSPLSQVGETEERHVLTQLGTFRRQLRRQRMRQEGGGS